MEGRGTVVEVGRLGLLVVLVAYHFSCGGISIQIGAQAVLPGCRPIHIGAQAVLPECRPFEIFRRRQVTNV